MEFNLESLPAVGELSSLTIAELRVHREACERAEVELSFIRRMIHGRLDVVYYDLTRRTEGRGSSDFELIVDNLSGILSPRIHAHYSGRISTFLAPDTDEFSLEELDSIVGSDKLYKLPELSDEEVKQIGERLIELEARISDQRAKLHDAIDKLHQEIVRRYKTGEASVDSLLESK